MALYEEFLVEGDTPVIVATVDAAGSITSAVLRRVNPDDTDEEVAGTIDYDEDTLTFALTTPLQQGVTLCEIELTGDGGQLTVPAMDTLRLIARSSLA